MDRLIGIGDIHGEFDLLVDLVENSIRFDPARDGLVFLGDYVDRGPGSAQVVSYASELRRRSPGVVTLLMGNHEELSLNALTRGDPHDMALWFMNGGAATVESYGGMEKARSRLVPFIETLALYVETERHVFVHAGVSGTRDLAETPREILLWSRAMERHVGGKTLIVGHTRHAVVTRYEGIVAVDTGAVVSGLLSGYDALNDTVYTASKLR